MVRALVVGLLTLLVAAMPALANGNGAQTETVHFSGTEVFVDTEGTCEIGVGSVVTIEFKGVEHTTVGPDGRFHITGTVTGRFSAVTPAGKTFTGRFTQWFGFNANSRSEAGTFTFSATGRSTDGDRVNAHLVAHMNVSASGNSNEFFQINCGGGDVTRV